MSCIIPTMNIALPNQTGPVASKVGEAKRQGVAVLLAVILLAAIYLVGYEIATPLWTLCYFLVVRRWKIPQSVAAAAAVLLVFYAMSVLLTSVIFPNWTILKPRTLRAAQNHRQISNKLKRGHPSCRIATGYPLFGIFTHPQILDT